MPLLLLLAGCGGPQSALSPSGIEANEIRQLFWMATTISLSVLILVSMVLAMALRGNESLRRSLAQMRLIIGGGIVLPAVVLTALLIYGFQHLGEGYARGSDGTPPDVTIVGKRWWWEVIYHQPNGNDVVSANELRLPVGRPVVLHLESDNVIHSFWAPQLAGKLDMIPGRTNVLTVTAEKTGVSRGQCAEFCGAAHALMSFHVVVMEPSAFADWLAREAGDAGDPRSDAAMRGRVVFRENGCTACHVIRGSEAAGSVGPDLTHVGSRLSLGAATLSNDAAAFRRWITENQHIKPDNLMPIFRHLTDNELDNLATYLDELE